MRTGILVGLGGSVAAMTMIAAGAVPGQGSIEADPEVTALVRHASAAHESLMRGDIEAYRAAVQVAPDFMLMDPFGGPANPAPASEEHWQRIGRFFKSGDAARFNPIAAFRSDDMIVLVANEEARVAVGSLAAQHWALRVTLVFRRDSTGWRLVHRHADPLAKAISLRESARLAGGKRPVIAN